MVLSWTVLLKYRLFVTSKIFYIFPQISVENMQFFDVTKGLYFNNAVQDSTMVIGSLNEFSNLDVL